MKKLLALTTSLMALAAAPAMAAIKEGNSTPLSGVYVGGYGGYDWTNFDTTTFSPDAEGWEGGVFAGYKLDVLMKRMNGFGIGMNGALEGFYGWSNADDTSGTLTAEKDNEWGVSFRPGFSVISNMTQPLGINPYGILGYRNSDFQTTSAGFTSSERYNGFELGVGTQLMAFGDIGLRLDYSHTWYDNENGVEPESNDLRLGLSVHF